MRSLDERGYSGRKWGFGTVNTRFSLFPFPHCHTSSQEGKNYFKQQNLNGLREKFLQIYSFF